MAKSLIVQLARFGDILQTRRLIKSLLQGNEVLLCVDKTQEKLARLAYPELEIIAVPAYKAKQETLLSETKKVFDRIKAEKCTDIYTLNHSPLSYALASLFEKEQTRGYIYDKGKERKSEWARLAFNYMQKRLDAPLHIMDYWGLFAESAVNPSKESLPMYINPSAYEPMLKWQEGRGTFSVALVLAGQNLRRSVPIESIVSLLKVLTNRFDKVEYILVGTEKEQILARKLLALLPPSLAKLVKDTTGKTNMSELFDLIKNSNLVLSPDTGALHCAAFLGVPSLSFFCSSAFCFETGAYGLGHMCIQALPSCAPCAESHHCTKILCHETFSSPSLLARLAKAKTVKAIEGYSILETSFDEMGLKYVQKEGVLEERKRADTLRALLFEYRAKKAILPHSSFVEDTASFLFDNSSCFFAQENPE